MKKGRGFAESVNAYNYIDLRDPAPFLGFYIVSQWFLLRLAVGGSQEFQLVSRARQRKGMSACTCPRVLEQPIKSLLSHD